MGHTVVEHAQTVELRDHLGERMGQIAAHLRRHGTQFACATPVRLSLRFIDNEIRMEEVALWGKAE